MKAIVADPLGGPENLKYTDLPDPEPKNGEVLLKVQAIGVNFIDVYFRKGFYRAPESPVRLGSEASGTVLDANGSSRFKTGDRVAYAMARGSYAELAAVPEKLLVHLPDAVSFDDAAAVMLQGMTAHYLAKSTFPLQACQACLIHAAAGGVGLLLVQVATLAGARVIGTVSTAEKAELVKKHGADQVIDYKNKDFLAEVKRLTSDKGVDVVYDSVGSDTFAKSLDCLKPRGMMVTFGQSSGPVGDIDPLVLSQKGSIFITRPSLANYVAEREELDWRASDLFDWIAGGKLHLNVYRTYPLKDAAAAHRDLEARRTTGKLLLKL